MLVVTATKPSDLLCCTCSNAFCAELFLLVFHALSFGGWCGTELAMLGVRATVFNRDLNFATL